MKKIYSLILLGGLLFFGVETAWGAASWVGNSAMNVNGTWYYAGTYFDWCTGGAFGNTSLGTITHLNLGGQSQAYESDGNGGGKNWGGGQVTMYYKIDNGTAQTIMLDHIGMDGNNNKFQSGGSTFTTTPIDITSLSAGSHTLKVWFYCDVNDKTEADPYSVTFTISKATITLAAACTDNGNYYGTYSNASAFEVPEGLTVSAISVASGKLTVTDYAAGDIVKANTGVLVSADAAGDHTILLSTETGDEKSGNMLKATGNSGITASSMTKSGYKFYRLTMHNGTQIGFYWGAENGAAFALGANKAYLEVPEGQIQAPSRFWFEDEATDINNVEAVEEGVKFFQNGKLYIKKNGVVYDMVGAIVK